MWFTVLSDEDSTRPLFGLDLTGRRQRAVLELLLLEPNRQVSVDFIIDELWPEAAPKTARNSVQRFIADIRKALGPNRDRLQTTDRGYVLRLEPGEVDVDEVRRLRHEAARLHDDPAAAAAALRQALDYFASRGRVAYTEAGHTALNSFAELRLQILEECIDHEISAGDAPNLIDELNELTRLHPYRERFWGQLMTALARAGRRVEALRTYDQLRRTLVDDTGLEPSSEIRALHVEILAEPADLTPSDLPEVADAPRAPLPKVAPHAALTGLIGRDQDYAAIRELLVDHRLVTIVGRGGIGKTTLARAVGNAVAAETDNRPIFVRLAEVRPGGAIAEVVATAMDLETEGATSASVSAAVVDVLAQSPRLIILDNAEHVVIQTADFVEQVLERTNASVLVTSRERLGVRDEWLHQLRRLTTPSADAEDKSESEELFFRRAAALGVDVTDQQDVVATVCHELEGLPLAIEIATGQLGYLGVQDLVDRLDSLLEMRASRSTNERHGSLASLLQWSWDRLTADEAATVEQLAVFAGPVDATAFVSIVGGDHQSTSSVVAKNLITATVENGRAYYELAASVRTFATRKATEAGLLKGHRDAHVDFVMNYLRRWPVVELNAWHDAIDAAAQHELEYVQALEWLDESERFVEVVELAVLVTGLWGRRRPRENLRTWAKRCSQIATGVDLSAEMAAGVRVMNLEAAFRFADYAAMAKHGEELVRTEAMQPTDIGTPLVGFYGTARHTFDLSETSLANVRAAHERAPFTATADLNVAQTRMWLGSTQLMNRDFEAALVSYRSVIDITTRPGGTVLWAEVGIATALSLLNRHDEAEAACSQMTSGVDDSVWNYATVIVHAIVTAAKGDTDAARVLLHAAAGQRIVDRRAASRNDFQIGFGIIASHAGETELAAALLADPLPQSPVMATLLINHRNPEAMTAQQWQRRWTHEMSSRLRSSSSLFSTNPASVEQDLHRWWPGR